MPLENPSPAYISGLNATNPAHSDGVNNGDAHIRLIKSALQTCFPNASSAVQHWTQMAAVGSDTGLQFAADATAGITRTATGKLGITGQLKGNGALPVGTVLSFLFPPDDGMAHGGTSTGTEGWIFLDGSSYPQANFPALAAKYGVGSGSFTVHNMVNGGYGRYLRQANAASGGNTGSYQSNQISSHNHGASSSVSGSVWDTGHSHSYYDSGHSHNVNASGNTGGQSNTHQHGTQNGSGGFLAGNYPGGATVGFSTSGTYDPVASLSITGDNNADHYHGWSFNVNSNTVGVGQVSFGINNATANITNNLSVSTSVAYGYTGDGSETRPETMVVLYCVKT